MPRSPTITEAQILDAARAVFLERVFEGTTAEVARRAGIAEGSVFRRFPTKHALFHAAMRPQLEDPPFLRDLAERVGQGDVREHLHQVGARMMDFFRRLMPLMMMAWSNRGTHGLPTVLLQPNPPPLRALKRIAGYFEAEIRLGRLRRHDPEALARAFIGSIQHYGLLEILLKGSGDPPPPVERYLHELVDLLFHGMAPPPADPAPRATARPRRRRSAR